MYRVLIVDDEALVRRGIKKSVNWNELGIEMVAEAANGVEALAQVLEDAPDIILLDINMPKMDGLEFASIVKKQFPFIKIAIVTGYHDFEYARSALRAGVDDYIVKPITKEDVNGIIKNLLEKIEEDRAGETKQKESDGRRERSELVNRVLMTGKNLETEIPHLCQLTGWDENQRVFFALMHEYTQSSKMLSDAAADELAEFAILNIAEEYLDARGMGMAFVTHRNEMAMILSCPKKDMVDALEGIQAGVFDFMEVPVEFAVSAAGSLYELPKLADQARVALSRAFVLSDQDIIYFEEIASKRMSTVDYPQDIETKLLERLFSGDMQQKLDLIDAFFDKLAEATPDVAKCKQMLLRLFIKISSTIESLTGRSDTASEELEARMFDPVEELEGFETLEEARVWLKALYQQTYDYAQSFKTRSGQLYSTIKEYIEQHYADSELNLKKCSEELFLSSNYISMILKKETGRTFVDYLNEYRIKKAKELLAQPDSKVYEVSGQVGFTHPTYFSSVFKKITGTSPKQYKENGLT